MKYLLIMLTLFSPLLSYSNSIPDFHRFAIEDAINDVIEVEKLKNVDLSTLKEKYSQLKKDDLFFQTENSNICKKDLKEMGLIYNTIIDLEVSRDLKFDLGKIHLDLIEDLSFVSIAVCSR